MKRRLLLTVLAVSAAGLTRVMGDPVLDWNAISSQAILTGGRPGPSGIIDFAVVQAAVHDAVQAYDKRFEPYAINVENASGSLAAAVAKVTHDIIVNRFPAQTAAMDTAYDNYLNDHDIDADDPGVSVGKQVAAGIIALRADDGSFPATFPAFNGANVPGVWRPTTSYLPAPPPSGASMATPWVGGMTPFALVSGDQFRGNPPPALKTGAYAKDYNEVKALGRGTGSSRTPEQTQLALFYSDNFIALWNRGLRGIAQTYLNDNSGDIARLFALAWLASGDAFITVWDSKLHYAFWRPVTAIQEGESDGNPKTIGDPTWQPLVNTPNYPDYTSGANGLTGAITRILKLYFNNDHLAFKLTSNVPNINPSERPYERFSDVADDVVEARILLGIHFRFADTVARKQGQQVAKWVFRNTLGPLHGDLPVSDDEE
jgi:hypothetical protein